MKRTVIIILVVLVLIFGILLVVPLLFKGKLVEVTKSTINQNVNAKVEFADVSLSLFRSFPLISLGLKDVTVTGKGEFQTDTLLNVALLQADISLKSLLSKSGINVEGIIIEKPKLHLISNKSGNVNWDLVVPNDTQKSSGSATENQEAESSFQLQLDKIDITNGILLYEDQSTDLLLDFSNINLEMAGEMYGTSTELQVNGDVEQVSAMYEGITYISKIGLETNTLLSVDYENMDIEIKENELLINRLPLELTGSIKIPSDSMFFDLSFQTKDSGFENFLALVPPDYEDELKNINTSGTASINGTVKGMYYNEIYPAFELNVNVENGNLHYADLPEEIKNIKAKILVSKPQGELDLTVVKIMNGHAEIRNNPVDLMLTLDHLVSDPRFDGTFIGKVNFDHLKDAIPMDSVNVSGMVDANLFVKGRYSAVEKEEYEKIRSDGVVLLDNFSYESVDLTQKVMVSEGRLDFSPENINLSKFKMKVGQSDFNLTGKVSNYLNYILKDGILEGDFQLTSSLVNLNELLRLQVLEEKEANPEEEILVFDVPENINLTFRSDIKQAVFDRVPISNIRGLISANKGKLVLNELNMNMLEGILSLNGSYENTPENNPLFDFGLDVQKFDIPVSYQTLTGLRKMLPVAGQSQGKLSTNIKIAGQLNSQLKFMPTSIDGSGLFNTENLRIVDSPVFNQLKGILKAEKLKNVVVDDFSARFQIDKGNLLLRPFKTKVAGQETTISGNLNVENLVDIRLDFNVQRDAFGNDIQSILSAIPGNKNITMLPAGVIIKGPVGKPEVKMDLSETRKTITDATKEDLQKSINKLGEGLKKLFEK